MPCCMLIISGITIKHPAISMIDFKFLEDKEWPIADLSLSFDTWKIVNRMLPI